MRFDSAETSEAWATRSSAGEWLFWSAPFPLLHAFGLCLSANHSNRTGLLHRRSIALYEASNHHDFSDCMYEAGLVSLLASLLIIA